MSTDLGLSDYQYYLGPPGGTGGLTFGLGTNVDVMSINGLTDLSVRRDDRPMARHHGSIPGLHLADQRVVELDIIARKGSLTNAQWRALIDDVEAAFSVEEEETSQRELHWQWPSESERFLRVRPYRRQTNRDWRTETGLFAIRTQLLASDPRWYEAAPTSLLNQTGTFNVTNGGKTRAYPKLVLSRSAATRVRVTNNTTGVVLDVNALPSASTDVTADMDVYIRGEAGLVIYVGSTNHYGQWVLPRTPFYLDPGVNSLTLNNGTVVDVIFWDPYL